MISILDLELEQEKPSLKQSKKPQLNLFPTLLNDWWDYRYETRYGERLAVSEEDLINKLNRVPFPATEPMEKGKSFESCLLKDATYTHPGDNGFGPFEFEPRVIDECRDYVRGAVPQQYVQMFLETEKYRIRFYGFVDWIKQYRTIDTKTGSRYEFPKFLNCYQHMVYLMGAKQMGAHVHEHVYLITDFKNVYRETYSLDEEHFTRELRVASVGLLDFIHLKRHLIHNPKLFT